MNSTIVNLRGTSGAGKSTVVFDLMNRFKAEPLGPDTKNRPSAYRLQLPSGQWLFVMGRYETQCGGCDTITTSQQLIQMVDFYEQHGHVLFEGLLISSYWGGLGEWSAKFGNRFIFAYLDTPLEVCLERVKLRRMEAGNAKPFNVSNTTKRVAAIEATKQRALREGRRVVIIPYKPNPAKAVLELFK